MCCEAPLRLCVIFNFLSFFKPFSFLYYQSSTFDSKPLGCVSFLTSSPPCFQVFERERVCWLEEKEIVLQYQKQLQANYAHIDNVNKQLQKQVDKQQPTTAQSQQQHRQHYLQLQQHL